MGIYLSQPNTVKESLDVDSVKFNCGCSSMQGWRSSQEDAHNMIPDFDTDTALFAVYDGHGGSEVAKYTALHLPAYLKKCEKENITMEKYLQDAFLSFDLTLKDPTNLKELQKLTGQSDDDSLNEKDNQSNQSETKENHVLKLTGDTPISAKISKSKKIQTILFSPHLLSKKKNKLYEDIADLKESTTSTNINKIKESGDCSFNDSVNSGPSTSSGLNDSSFFANESFITPKEAEALREEAKLPIEVLAEKYKNPNEEGDANSTSQVQPALVQSLLSETTKCMLMSESGDQQGCSKDVPASDDDEDDLDEDDDQDFEISSDEPDSDGSEEASELGSEESFVENDEKIDAGKSTEEAKVEEEVKEEGSEVNHSTSGKLKRENISGNGALGGKSNGHLINPEDECTPSPSKKLKFDPEDVKAESSKNPEVKLNGHLECEESTTIEGTEEKSEEAEKCNGSIIEHGEEEGGDGLSDSESDDDEEEEDEESMSFDLADQNEKLFAKLEGAMEKPAYDSGCTAVVCLLRGSTLYTANVGDSRCIVSCDGVAQDMSIDHKPEDKFERDRIEGAGGVVTEDGRVNEGLNLSRALGDHSYKEVAGLSAEKQMISALPDVTELKLTPKHHFIVIACDGIWNSMSSQEVVDFVEERRLKYADKPSKICEELFDRCLAPDTTGDGTGCDNMTCIIVLLKDGAFPVEA